MPLARHLFISIVVDCVPVLCHPTGDNPMAEAVPLSEEMASDDYAADEGHETDNMMMADGEEEEQMAAQRMKEEMKAKRLVRSYHVCICCCLLATCVLFQ